MLYFVQFSLFLDGDISVVGNAFAYSDCSNSFQKLYVELRPTL